MSLSVLAIKHVDPTWNKVEIGDYLWPYFFYKFGLKSYANEDATNADSNAETLTTKATVLKTQIATWTAL